MPDAILVLNAGSSSLKFSAFLDGARPALLLRGQIEGLNSQARFIVRDCGGKTIAEREWAAGTTLGHEEAIEYLFQWGRQDLMAAHTMRAAGHRIVHGGTTFTHPVRIDAGVLDALEALVPLAPLHQPHNIAAIRAVARRAPGLPQVACFDTSFHRTQPVVAQAFGLPRRFTEEGVHRYGFHGLSYEYIAAALPALDSKAARGRTIVAHLGNGASLCALHAGRSVATTMSFTPLDGLIMGTRCGALDPGVIPYLVIQHGLNVREVEDILYHQSGLLGVSEISSDMRTLLANSDPRAGEAVDLFVYRISREIGSLAASLQGLDAIVFTGGIGERSASIRRRVCRDAAWLGVELEESENDRGGPRITKPGSRVTAWVVPTDEEQMIARHTRRVLESMSD